MEVRHIAPPSLLRAMERQRLLEPDDEKAIERLYEYLDRTRPTMQEICDTVCEFYLCSNEDLNSRHTNGSRLKRFIIPRQIFCYLAYKYTRYSLAQIGRRIGYFDHTTVSHSVHRVGTWLVTNPVVADDLDLLRLRISEKMLRRPGGASC